MLVAWPQHLKTLVLYMYSKKGRILPLPTSTRSPVTVFYKSYQIQNIRLDVPDRPLRSWLIAIAQWGARRGRVWSIYFLKKHSSWCFRQWGLLEAISNDYGVGLLLDTFHFNIIILQPFSTHPISPSTGKIITLPLSTSAWLQPETGLWAGEKNQKHVLKGFKSYFIAFLIKHFFLKFKIDSILPYNHPTVLGYAITIFLFGPSPKFFT